VARHRARLHQLLRELRASALRRTADEKGENRTRALVLARQASAAAGPRAAGRRATLDGLTLALAAHDPERVIERGYAVVDDRQGNVISSAADARRAGAVRLFFADAGVDATIDQDDG
jgi:exodeoxyribonuclease VII large subunit